MGLEGDVTVGVDIGTTSVKAVAVDADGTVLARTRVPHELLTPVPGAFEHDIDRAWRDDVLTALGQVSQGLEVVAVNVSAMVPSLGSVDAAGRAVGPGLLYGDHRGADRGDADRAEAGDSGELLAFLRWQAENSDGATGYWPAQAVANHALTGEAVIDSTTAMCALPLFDGAQWDAQMAGSAGVDVEALPRVVPGFRRAGHVLDGLPAAGAVVGGGTIDALGEQIVAGADRTGDVLVICGGTLITWIVVDDWVEVPGLWTVPHTTPGKVLVGGPSNAGGLFIDRVARWLGPSAAHEVDRPLSDDLPIWLPYLRGERSPLHRPDLRAEVHGLSLHHEASDLRTAAFEASAFVLRHHLDLAAHVSSPRRIVATGGGVRAGAWMQSLADVTGLPVDVVNVPEGAALGSAFIARCVAKLETSMADAARWAKPGRTVEPDEARRDGVENRYSRFRELTEASLT